MQLLSVTKIISDYPRLCIVVGALLSQALGSRINFLYQMAYLGSGMTAAQEDAFHRINILLHAVLYPLGAVVGMCVFIRILNLAGADARISPAVVPSERNLLYQAPLRIALFCFSTWLPAIYIFPSYIERHAGALQSSVKNHFIVTNLVSGLASGSLTLLVLGFVLARVSDLRRRGFLFSVSAAYYTIGVASLVAPVIPLICVLFIIWQMTDPAGLDAIDTDYLRLLLFHLIAASGLGLLLGAKLELPRR